MNREEICLLQILKAHLHGATPEPIPDADWDKLYALARIHNVSGILGYMVMSWPLCPREELVRKFRSVCLGSIAAFTRRGVMAHQLSGLLSEDGIDHIMMKGYVLRHFYPVPELRSFGDIDLVIRPEDRRRCHEKILSLGFEVKTDWEPVYSYVRGKEYYEFHTRIMEVDVSDKADYQGYFQNPWANAVPVENHCWELRPEYHFLYLLTHIAKHITGSGAGIRMYLDVAVFVQHYAERLDWQYIREELEKLCLSAFANTVLNLVQECFGISGPIPLTPVQGDILEAFLELTMAGGVFGRNAGDNGMDALKQDSRCGSGVSRSGTLAKRLLPSARSIQNRYTYLQDRPWLLPAAWVHRLVKTRGDWRSHAREAKNILSADRETVAGLNRLYRDIGL